MRKTKFTTNDFMENPKKNRIHDITATMRHDMPFWPGDSHVYRHHYVKSFDNGHNVNISRINCSMHVGTHLDAPYHKIQTGMKLNELPVERFMGNAYVYDLTFVQKSIKLNDIQGLDLHKCKICLFKTKNSALWKVPEFDADFIFIDKEAALFLVDTGIAAIGIDYLSVDPFEDEEPLTHNIFFRANVLIYEGLDLRNVSAGQYYFIGLPLRIHDAEASPVRALLIDKCRER